MHDGEVMSLIPQVLADGFCSNLEGKFNFGHYLSIISPF